MTTPLTSDGKFNFGNCAGSKHTERKRKPFPPQVGGRGGPRIAPRGREGCFCLQQHWFHNPQSRESKNWNTPTNNGWETRRPPRRLQGEAFSLCFVCSSLGGKMSRGQEWHMQQERLAGLRDLLYLHSQPLMHFSSTHPLLGFFFFSTFFFSRAPNPRHMTFC